ncbi:hypothetical protein SteCoe_33346 [Stentor coeruleus]|uniref:Uncharacterized protein n=1 Tax=Stentor coeruleus TaxID=5963 RepID=A0A1R2AX60_9CILI|nr:hypothetical protein SteCoe_33346 [Stentor coeruleus]
MKRFFSLLCCCFYKKNEDSFHKNSKQKISSTYYDHKDLKVVIEVNENDKIIPNKKLEDKSNEGANNLGVVNEENLQLKSHDSIHNNKEFAKDLVFPPFEEIGNAFKEESQASIKNILENNKTSKSVAETASVKCNNQTILKNIKEDEKTVHPEIVYISHSNNQKIKKSHEIKNSIISNQHQFDSENNFISLKGKIIMAIGETGTGKSTFLNQLANTIENKRIEDLKIYFELENFPNASVDINIIPDIIADLTFLSSVNHTKSIKIIEVKRSSNEIYTLIDTPGIISNIDGSVDIDFVDKIKLFLSLVEKIDYIIFVEKSNANSCTKSVRNTISELNGIFLKKKCKVVPIFTFYPGTLVFNVKEIPFDENICYGHIHKLNNCIFGYSEEERIKRQDKLRNKFENSKNKVESILTKITS